MAALILTMIMTLFVAAGLWFSLGSRFNINVEESNNELLNFVAYYLASLPFCFVVVFFGLG